MAFNKSARGAQSVGKPRLFSKLGDSSIVSNFFVTFPRPTCTHPSHTKRAFFSPDLTFLDFPGTRGRPRVTQAMQARMANQKLQAEPLRELALGRLRAENAEIAGVRYGA
jgi:hypothetical protein